MITGIDPQPTVIAFCTIKDQDIFECKEIRLKKKSAFKNAQDWQIYLYKAVKEVFEFIDDKSPIFIEQQRGRINSILEQTILIESLSRKRATRVLHPLTWKRLTNTKCMKDHTLNKREAERKVLHRLREFERKKGLSESKVPHNMCDAILIAEAGKEFLSRSS